MYINPIVYSSSPDHAQTSSKPDENPARLIREAESGSLYGNLPRRIAPVINTEQQIVGQMLDTTA